MNREIHVTQRFDAPAEHVFDAWLDPETAGQWLFATASRPMSQVEIDARPGGSFHFSDGLDGDNGVQTGQYVEIARPRRIVFTLSERQRARDRSRVRVEIIPAGTGCELTLVHERVRPDQARHLEGRWAGMLYGLGTMLEKPLKESRP